MSEKHIDYMAPQINIEDYVIIASKGKIAGVESDDIGLIHSEFINDLIEALDNKYHFDEAHRKAVMEVLGYIENGCELYDADGKRTERKFILDLLREQNIIIDKKIYVKSNKDGKPKFEDFYNPDYSLDELRSMIRTGRSKKNK